MVTCPLLQPQCSYYLLGHGLRLLLGGEPLPRVGLEAVCVSRHEDTVSVGHVTIVTVSHPPMANITRVSQGMAPTVSLHRVAAAGNHV